VPDTQPDTQLWELSKTPSISSPDESLTESSADTDADNFNPEPHRSGKPTRGQGISTLPGSGSGDGKGQGQRERERQEDEEIDPYIIVVRRVWHRYTRDIMYFPLPTVTFYHKNSERTL
jgi:hypothetical protein